MARVTRVTRYTRVTHTRCVQVELVKITTPEQSDEEHHKLVENAEACLQVRGEHAHTACHVMWVTCALLRNVRNVRNMRSGRSGRNVGNAWVTRVTRGLQALELPYRKMRLCSGDIGFSARLCYDLEVRPSARPAHAAGCSC